MPAYVTRREKDILKMILTSAKKKMSTTELKARAERDLYIAVSSVQTMCYHLEKREFLSVAERIPGAKYSSKLLCVYEVTPKGVEAIHAN